MPNNNNNKKIPKNRNTTKQGKLLIVCSWQTTCTKSNIFSAKLYIITLQRQKRDMLKSGEKAAKAVIIIINRLYCMSNYTHTHSHSLTKCSGPFICSFCFVFFLNFFQKCVCVFLLLFLIIFVVVFLCVPFCYFRRFCLLIFSQSSVWVRLLLCLSHTLLLGVTNNNRTEKLLFCIFALSHTHFTKSNNNNNDKNCRSVFLHVKQTNRSVQMK